MKKNNPEMTSVAVDTSREPLVGKFLNHIVDVRRRLDSDMKSEHAARREAKAIALRHGLIFLQDQQEEKLLIKTRTLDKLTIAIRLYASSRMRTRRSSGEPAVVKGAHQSMVAAQKAIHALREYLDKPIRSDRQRTRVQTKAAAIVKHISSSYSLTALCLQGLDWDGTMKRLESTPLDNNANNISYDLMLNELDNAIRAELKEKWKAGRTADISLYRLLNTLKSIYESATNKKASTYICRRTGDAGGKFLFFAIDVMRLFGKHVPKKTLQKAISRASKFLIQPSK